MNGGGNATDPQHNPLALALGFPTSGLTVFDPMQFRAIQNSIQDVRAKLDAMEEQSRIGLANYELKVRLEEEAEKGRRAEQALKALERGQVPVYTERPPVPGPSTAMHSGANYTMPPHVYPVPPQFAAPASPPQARIEEVTGSPNAERSSSQNSRSSTSQHAYTQGIPSRSNMYIPQQNANSYAHLQQSQQWQGYRQDSAVNPQHLHYYQQNGQSSRSGYTGQYNYGRQHVSSSTSTQVPLHPGQGRSYAPRAADVYQNLQPAQLAHRQPQQMQFHPNNVTENNYSSSSPPLPPPIEESRPAAETQLHDVYNRHHASSSLANALVSPTDGVIPPRTGNSDSSRAATNSQSTVGLSGTTTVSSDQRQTYPGIPQAANALVRVSEQHPSVGPSQAPNIVVKTTSLEAGSNTFTASGSSQTVRPVPNTLRRPNGMGSFQSTIDMRSSHSKAVPLGPPASSSATYTLAGGHDEAQWANGRGTHVASYGSQAMEAGIPTRPAAQVEVAPPQLYSAQPAHYKDPLTQTRVPSGVVNVPSTRDNVAPATPERQNPRPTPLTPASANRRSLAKSILRALGRPSKRKAEERHSPSPSATSTAPDDEPPPKRQAIDRPIPGPTELIQDRIAAEEAVHGAISIPNGADVSAVPTALRHEDATTPEETVRDTIAVPNGADVSAGPTNSSHEEETTADEIVHDGIPIPNGADFSAVLSILNHEEVTAGTGTTEQDVQDLMEAFAHAVPVIVPAVSPARPPSVILEDEEHSAQEISSSSNQVVEEVASVEARSTTPASVPPGIASPTERPREEPFFESAFAPFEEDETPLFLPSPDLLPSAGPNHKIIDISEKMKASTSKLVAEERVSGPTPGLRVYVEVPTVATWLRRMPKSSAKGKEKEITTLPDLKSSQIKEPEQQMNVEAAETTTEDEHRQQLARNAVKIASSRLRRRPCSWRECPVVLNAAERLKSHVAEHVDISSKYTEGTIFPCRWKDCIRRFNKPEVLLQHLQNHVRKHIECSFEGCEEVFDHPMRLLSHIEGRHMNDKLRQSAEPFERPPLAQLPPLPSRMFTYHTVDLPVKQARISSERRKRLGPWVLKRIFGPVNFDRTRQGGRYLMRPKGDTAMRATDKANHTSYGKEDQRDRFHFLLRESPNQINCEDLDSVHVSELVERGLAFLPDKDGPQGPQEELILTSLMQSENPGAKQLEEDASSSTARMPSPSKISTPPKQEQVAHSEPQASHSEPAIPGPAAPALKPDAPAVDTQQPQPQLEQQEVEVAHMRIADPPSLPQDQERHAVTPVPETVSDVSDPAPKPEMDLPEIATLMMDVEVTAEEALDAEVKSASAAGDEDTQAVEDLV